MEYKIEKGIPIPEKAGKKYRELVAKMGIGDSFLATPSVLNCLRGYASGLGTETLKFSGRKVDDGFRIWLKSK